MDLIRRLHQAIKNDDSAGIQAAVAAGADVDHVWGMQGTALCQAILTGRETTVSLLLELGCDVNGEDFDGGLPLTLAIRKHLPNIALLLIAVPSCDVNVLDPVSKQRPLCSAVTEGMSDVVEVLVQDPRCNITQGNNIGNSALHLSLLHKQDDITKILARCEGFRFLTNLAGHAPVHIVATLGDCNSLDLLYPTPCRTVETLHAPQSMEKGSEPPLTPVYTSAMLRRELDQRVKYTGDTALHLAVREKHDEMARRLVALGAAVDLQNNSGHTALLLACAADNSELVLYLLKNGAPPNQGGYLRLQQRTLLGTHSRESSLTPLHIAASANNMVMVQALCEFGANINSCDERGRSVLHVALLNGAGDVALYLLNQTLEINDCALVTGGNSVLHVVCKCTTHAAEITTRLVEHGFSLQQPNRLGNLPLHEALCWENPEVVRVLLQYGADPSAPGEMGVMPLAIAARTGRVEMAELLLAAGAGVDGASPQGDDCSQSDTEEEDWTPLREALQAGMVDFARYLVDAGCDLSRERYLFASPVASFSRTARSTFSAALSDEDDSEDDDDDDDDGIPDVVKDNPELFHWLRRRARNARSLVQLSLEAVRGVFRHGDPPFALMLALPLPEKMIARLFYRDTL